MVFDLKENITTELVYYSKDMLYIPLLIELGINSKLTILTNIKRAVLGISIF